MLQTSGMQSLREVTPPGVINKPAFVDPAPFNPGLAPWRVADFHFPFYGRATERLAYCMRYAILAPFTHNTQPWRFALLDDRLELYADRTCSLPLIDPEGRELIISCGAALANLCIAIRHFGYQDDVALFPQSNDTDPIETIRLRREHKATCHEETLFKAIATRRTNRSAYEDTPISLSLWCELHTARKSHGVGLAETFNIELKLAITKLVSEGDRRQMGSTDFRAELSDWIYPAEAESHDGIPCCVQMAPKVLDFAAPIMARMIQAFDMRNFTTARDADLFNILRFREIAEHDHRYLRHILRNKRHYIHATAYGHFYVQRHNIRIGFLYAIRRVLHAHVFADHVHTYLPSEHIHETFALGH